MSYSERFSALGKQVLEFDREHIADARDMETARMIAKALNEAHPPRTVRGATSPTNIRLHSERRENDEMTCSCGARWDIGESHP